MKQISLFGDESFDNTNLPHKELTEEVPSPASEPTLPSDLNCEYAVDEKKLEENYTNDFFIFEEPDLGLPAEDRPVEEIPNTGFQLPKPPKQIMDSSPKKGRGRMKLSEMEDHAELLSIPNDEELFKKRYYSIGTVAEMFNVNISLLRYWENEFDILKPKKNGKGDRHFRPEDIKNIQMIYHLLREKKYTLQGAKDFLKKNRNADKHFEVIESLKNLKSFLLELKSTV